MPSTFEQSADVNQLPHHLSERVRVIHDAPLSTEGDFVLYWMHHAVRSHENPAFEKPLDLSFDAAFVHESPVRWAARNSSKPSRPAAECWMFHADAKWSLEHAGVDAEASVRSLINSFFKSIGQTPVDPIFYQTRYWRFAAAANPLNVGRLWDAALKIGLCGDWCQMSRFEGAALSGMAMAGRILNMKIGVPHKLQNLNA